MFPSIRSVWSVATSLCCLLVDLPVVLAMPTRLYLPLGMMGRIDCPIEANPGITHIVWTKGGRVVKFASVDRVKLTSRGTLVIQTVMADDNGTYSCTPYSAIGAGKSSSPVQVIVRGRCTLLSFLPGNLLHVGWDYNVYTYLLSCLHLYYLKKSQFSWLVLLPLTLYSTSVL